MSTTGTEPVQKLRRGNVWRTTTVRLTAMFIAIFVGFAVVLLALSA